MDGQTYAGTVRARRRLSEHLVRVTVGGLEGWRSSGVPDEYVTVTLPAAGAQRIYTISDHFTVEGDARVDIDVALHAPGIGADWARTCSPGGRVGVSEPRGTYDAPSDVGWQLLVADITGLPALARILRERRPGQRVDVVMVLGDSRDRIDLPSPADVSIDWQVTELADVPETLTAAVTAHDLPVEDRYVWLAGEASASRAVRRHLRRELGWPPADLCTFGYWQIDGAAKAARYSEVAAEVEARVAQARRQFADDEAAYLDALDDIYDSVGL